MAVLNRQYGYLFLSEPHIASRAITAALMKHDGSADFHQHATLEELRNHGVSCEALLKFSCIRHPCDWLTTRYLHLSSWHRQGFEAFVRYHMQNVFNAEPTVFRHARNVDRLLRYETLSQDLNGLLADIGAPQVALELIGATAHKLSWSKYFDESTRGLVRATLRDFADYGYEV